MAPMELQRDYDAVVVGARCAGASTALLLARAGKRVLLVDRDREGADTLSTHALMRAGVLQLHRWGILPAVVASGAPPVRAATFHYGDEAVPVTIAPRDGVDALYAPRRTVLDPLLVSAAREAGAQVEFGLAAAALVRGETRRVEGVVVTRPGGAPVVVGAGIVIGADGLRSRVARLVSAPAERVGASASAVLYGHWRHLPVDGYHWHYLSGASAGAIPTNDGATCLFVAFPAHRFREALADGLDASYRRLLAEAAPALAARLPAASLDGRIRAFPGEPGVLRRAWGPGWALVGDAGYFRDPLTAHGMTDALRDAELLARAVIRGGDPALAGYQSVRDAAATAFFEATDRVASFEWDLDTLRGLHRTLAKQMAAETDLVRSLDGGPRAAPPAMAAAPAA